MASAATGKLNLHVMRLRHAPGDVHRFEGKVARVGTIGFECHGEALWRTFISIDIRVVVNGNQLPLDV